jgi:hypothetical protein
MKFSTHGDTAAAGTQRYLLYAVAALCLVLVAFAGLRATSLIAQARTQALAEAEQAIAQATQAHIEQDRVPNALIGAVEALIGQRDLDLNYVTLRNAENVTLISRGRFAERFQWLGAGMARQWRGWDYQAESAETNRALQRQSQRVGYAQFGVSWFAILGRAGVPLIIWVTALLAGVVGFLGALAASATSRTPAAEQKKQPRRGPAVAKPAAPPTTAGERARSPLSRFARRRERGRSSDEFAPIVDKRRQGMPGDAMPERSQVTRRDSAPGPTTSATKPQTPRSERADTRPAPRKTEPAPPPAAPPRPSAPASAPAEPSAAASGRKEPVVEPEQRPTVPSTPAPSAPAEKSAPKPPAPTPPSQPVREPTPKRSAEPAPAPPAESQPEPKPPTATPKIDIEPAPAHAELHAPRLDAQPTLGDDTLDLRFYPIWRDAERKVLAGACAALAWRSGETRLVDSDTLTRLAEREGALRAFTQWIARRFSLLHSNWRTLEIATVPIVLPIPSAMLGFADAEAVWRDALRRTDRDPNDLILWLGGRVRRHVHSSLPVRRALMLAGHDKPAPADCDVACIDVEQIGPDIEAWHARIEQLKCPVLIGSIGDPEPYARLLNHPRVLWFSQADADLCSPRAFARLLTRHATQPI